VCVLCVKTYVRVAILVSLAPWVTRSVPFSVFFFFAAGRESQLPVFVQVNTSAEPQKGGVAPEDCVATVKHVATKCPRLAFQGLMTIGKLGDVSAEYFEVRWCSV